MAIHEHLPRIAKPELRLMGWTKARELVKVARKEGQEFDCAPWVHKASSMLREEFKRGGCAVPNWSGDRAARDPLL